MKVQDTKGSECKPLPSIHQGDKRALNSSQKRKKIHLTRHSFPYSLTSLIKISTHLPYIRQKALPMHLFKDQIGSSSCKLLHYDPHSSNGFPIKFCSKLSGLPKPECCFSDLQYCIPIMQTHVLISLLSHLQYLLLSNAIRRKHTCLWDTVTLKFPLEQLPVLLLQLFLSLRRHQTKKKKKKVEEIRFHDMMGMCFIFHNPGM